MNQPLVSVIVPTFNSSSFLDECLRSIKSQSYENIELIVVDNNSVDNTKEIALRHTEKVFSHGPERSAQRNYGVSKCVGAYIAIIDSDMLLSPDVVQSCIGKMSENPSLQGVVIPEESFGTGWWSQCKKLERSFYVGIDWMEAARFFNKQVYVSAGGYDEGMVSGEDWDLSQRIGATGEIGRADSRIYHNEGQLSLLNIIRKKYYYARKFTRYVSANRGGVKMARQTGIADRYSLFFSSPRKLFGNPLLGLSMLFMKTCEFGFGGVGYLMGKLSAHEKYT